MNQVKTHKEFWNTVVESDFASGKRKEGKATLNHVAYYARRENQLRAARDIHRAAHQKDIVAAFKELPFHPQ